MWEGEKKISNHILIKTHLFLFLFDSTENSLGRSPFQNPIQPFIMWHTFQWSKFIMHINLAIDPHIVENNSTHHLSKILWQFMMGPTWWAFQISQKLGTASRFKKKQRKKKKKNLLLLGRNWFHPQLHGLKKGSYQIQAKKVWK